MLPSCTCLGPGKQDCRDFLLQQASCWACHGVVATNRIYAVYHNTFYNRGRQVHCMLAVGKSTWRTKQVLGGLNTLAHG